MCRLLGYLGTPIQLDRLLYKPDHSLVEQSYNPREMTSGVVNADGFGIGWYGDRERDEPFTYRQILPIWSDLNLPQLSRYIESGCSLGYVRSATPGQAVDLSNCQPFGYDRLLYIHNGFVKNFRHTLYRPIRDRLSDEVYLRLHGTTDSEHLFASIVQAWIDNGDRSLEAAVSDGLTVMADLARQYQVAASANLIIGDGTRLIATRFAVNTAPPSLYWLRDDPNFPDSAIIASEPLFEGNWHSCPEQSMIGVGENLDIQIDRL